MWSQEADGCGCAARVGYGVKGVRWRWRWKTRLRAGIDSQASNDGSFLGMREGVVAKWLCDAVRDDGCCPRIRRKLARRFLRDTRRLGIALCGRIARVTVSSCLVYKGPKNSCQVSRRCSKESSRFDSISIAVGLFGASGYAKALTIAISLPAAARQRSSSRLRFPTVILRVFSESPSRQPVFACCFPYSHR